jgi:hypothetical protein
MLWRISWLSWLTFTLSVLGAIVLTWHVDSHTSAGVARLVGSAIAVVVAVLALVAGAQTGRRISDIEAGRYPRLRPGASLRIAERIESEIPQTATIDGESGDDVREVAAVIVTALRSAKWHIGEVRFGGPLWDEGRGVMIHHTEAAAPAATALIEALKTEGLPVSDAGACTTGLPIQIAFRRP